MKTNDDLVLEFLETSNLSKGSKRNYKSIANMFISWFGKHLFEVEIKDLKRYNVYLNENPEISLETKKNRYNLTKVFIQGVFENNLIELSKLHDTIILIEMFNYFRKKNTATWTKIEEGNHKAGREHIYLTKEEILTLLRRTKIIDYEKYLIFRILLESGCRKYELLSMDLDVKVNSHYEPIEDYLKKRMIYTPKGKTGKHIYYCSQDLADKLLEYVKARRMKKVNSKALFLSKYKRRYSQNALNFFLNYQVEKINEKEEKQAIDPKITIHTFRRTLNNFRFKMGCPDKWLTILLNQQTEGVNFDHYVDKSKGFLEQYDKWYPYKELII